MCGVPIVSGNLMTVSRWAASSVIEHMWRHCGNALTPENGFLLNRTSLSQPKGPKGWMLSYKAALTYSRRLTQMPSAECAVQRMRTTFHVILRDTSQPLLLVGWRRKANLATPVV